MTKFIELPDRNGENHVFNINSIQYITSRPNHTCLFFTLGSQLETYDTNLSYKEVIKLFKLYGLM